MKTILLTALLFCFVPFLSAQTFDLEYIYSEEPWPFLNPALVKEDKLYLAGSDYTCHDGIVVGMDESGVSFKTNLKPGGYWQVTDIDWNTTSDLLVGCGYWRESDDYISNTDGLYVFGLDADGNLLFENLLTISDYPEFYFLHSFPSTLTTKTDSGTIIGIHWHLVWFDEIGNLTDIQLEVVDTTLLGITQIHDTLILAHTESDLHLLNGQGELQETIAANSIIQSMYLEADKVYILTLDHLMVYDLVAETIELTSDFFTSIENPTGITGNSNDLFIYQKGVLNTKYIQLNKNDFQI